MTHSAENEARSTCRNCGVPIVYDGGNGWIHPSLVGAGVLDSVDAAGFRDLCRALSRHPSDALEGVALTRPGDSEVGCTTPPPASESAEVVRGWRTYPDGSQSPVERWVKHADGDWVSLDSTRRTSGDILMAPAHVIPPAVGDAVLSERPAGHEGSES